MSCRSRHIKVITIAVSILVAVGCSLTGCGGNKSKEFDISETELSEETAGIADENTGKETTTYGGFELQETKKPIESRVQSKYDTTPPKSEKVIFHTMKSEDNSSYWKYEDDEFKIIVPIVNNDYDGKIDVTINDKRTEATLEWSDLKYVAICDINKDGKKDIIFKLVKWRTIENSVLLAVEDGYVEIDKTNYDEFKIDAKLLDDFKMQVLCEAYNIEKVIDICDGYKGSLIAEWEYSEDGKVIGSSWLQNNMGLKLVDLQYYYVEGEFIAIKKYHYTDGKWDTGLAVICEYKLSGNRFERTNVKFVEENWNVG